MKPVIPLKGGAEYDCFYARGIYFYLLKAGVSSSIKKGYNRRSRRIDRKGLRYATDTERI